MYTIEQNVPISSRGYLYPELLEVVKILEVNDSFFIPVTDSLFANTRKNHASKIRNILESFQTSKRLNIHSRFVLRTLHESGSKGIRIWRIK